MCTVTFLCRLAVQSHLVATCDSLGTLIMKFDPCNRLLLESSNFQCSLKINFNHGNLLHLTCYPQRMTVRLTAPSWVQYADRLRPLPVEGQSVRSCSERK